MDLRRRRCGSASAARLPGAGSAAQYHIIRLTALRQQLEQALRQRANLEHLAWCAVHLPALSLQRRAAHALSGCAARQHGGMLIGVRAELHSAPWLRAMKWWRCTPLTGIRRSTTVIAPKQRWTGAPAPLRTHVPSDGGWRETVGALRSTGSRERRDTVGVPWSGVGSGGAAAPPAPPRRGDRGGELGTDASCRGTDASVLGDKANETGRAGARVTSGTQCEGHMWRAWGVS